MNEVIKLVAQKTGLSEGVARTAVNTVIGFLKERLPAQVSESLDAVLAGQDVSNTVSELTKGIEGLLGKK